MRRMLAMVAFSLLAALAVPTMASATHSNGQGPAQDFLSGAAKGPVPIPCAPGTAAGHFHTNGQAQDNVTNVATGQFWTELEFDPPCLGFTHASFSGDVTCVNSYLGPENSSNWAGLITEVLLTPGDVPGVPGILAPGMGMISRHIDESPPTSADRALGFTTPAPLPCNHPLLSTPFIDAADHARQPDHPHGFLGSAELSGNMSAAPRRGGARRFRTRCKGCRGRTAGKGHGGFRARVALVARDGSSGVHSTAGSGRRRTRGMRQQRRLGRLALGRVDHVRRDRAARDHERPGRSDRSDGRPQTKRAHRKRTGKSKQQSGDKAGSAGSHGTSNQPAPQPSLSREQLKEVGRQQAKQARVLCKASTLEGLAQQYGIKNADPDAVAKAYAAPYLAGVRAAVAAGCKAGLLEAK